jgi:superfamily I DNA and/or RNA helicase
MTCNIQRLSWDVFYSDEVLINAVSDPEEKAQRLALWNMDEYKVNSNALLPNVPWATEELIATSFANAGNRKVVLGLAGKLVRAGLCEPKDIAILVGYEAQWGLYIKDLHELAGTDRSMAWSSVRAFKIDAIQGNEADIVIFDYVRTGKKHGFMGAFRRLNVACSRGRFGFYLVASASTLKTVQRFGYRTPSKVHKWFESRGAKATLPEEN